MQIVYFIEASQLLNSNATQILKESFHAPGCVGHILDD